MGNSAWKNSTVAGWLCAASLLAGQSVFAGEIAFNDTNIPTYGLSQASFAGRPVSLENKQIRVAFDSRSGALVQLEDKTTHWVVERRPALGVSFRIFAPLPDRNYNPIFGQDQPATEVKKLSDHEICLVWKNLLSRNGGVLPITFTSIVTLTNGTLTFNATLENDSSLTVDSIDYPCFGDLNPPTRDASLEINVMRDNKLNDLWATQIYPHFGNEHGYWGVFFPLKTREAQQSPFCLIDSPHEGLCVQMDVSNAPYRMQYTFELQPGVLDSIDNLVPEEDEISGIPVHLEFRTCHFIWLKPHSIMKLAPILVRSYQGDLHSGIRLYKQWRSSSSH